MKIKKCTFEDFPFNLMYIFRFEIFNCLSDSICMNLCDKLGMIKVGKDILYSNALKFKCS